MAAPGPGSSDSDEGDPVIAAAGTVPWRRRRGTLEVALVHRPKYDDWSWPKGKLDPGEDWPVAAVRETLEETGWRVRLGRPLPTATYRVLDKSGRAGRKEVRYWAAEIAGGSGALENEIDEVAWLDEKQARRRLDYAHDRDQLEAVVAADRAGTLRTWPLAVVRHAKALPRSAWSDPDDRRPLDARGEAQADALVALLAAYGVQRLVSSSSARCIQTLTPYATSTGLKIAAKPDLSEEGFADRPQDAPRRVAKLAGSGSPLAVCGHGPVLPSMLEAFGTFADPTDRAAAEDVVRIGMNGGLAKGEVLVVHLVGWGASAHVVAIERHRAANS